jgi:hypothetical protein
MSPVIRDKPRNPINTGQDASIQDSAVQQIVSQNRSNYDNFEKAKNLSPAKRKRRIYDQKRIRINIDVDGELNNVLRTLAEAGGKKTGVNQVCKYLIVKGLISLAQSGENIEDFKTDSKTIKVDYDMEIPEIPEVYLKEKSKRNK